jgi:cyclopropane fatty-acyl-phospholipid synthase-like methyltransferase
MDHPSGEGLSYFEIQAYVGTTKHMGGLQATRELIDLCHIDRHKRVLDVGCGVGATACYLAKEVGCRVLGVDLRESMVAQSQERAMREGVADRVEFRVADARELPFEDGLFDVVLSESVATFVQDKAQVMGEYVRVTRPGGYVGLNEEVWLQTPSDDTAARIKRLWDIQGEIPTVEGWTAWLQGAGLHDPVARTYKVDPRRESSQIKRYRLGEIWRMLYRALVLYVKSPAFRKYMSDRPRLPKRTFDYFGYAVIVGKKQG